MGDPGRARTRSDSSRCRCVAHFLLLTAWASRNGDCRVARNLALRWLEEHPRAGIDPDVCVLAPAPADFDALTSWRLWEAGRVAPVFCVEVVSATHPYKDYLEVPERYAALGAFELLVFDPALFGPKALGGPVPLQLWRRDSIGAFERVHFGEDPVFSEALEAWLSVDQGHLVISSDRAGASRWLTAEEHERAAREQAERRVRELEEALRHANG
ncbi:MAG: Uma2 family endonuclease [Polyangiaceae bacterium]